MPLQVSELSVFCSNYAAKIRIALASATRYPDLYAAAIGFAGVCDWVRPYERATGSGRSFWDWHQRHYGDAKKNPGNFRTYSLFNYDEAVKCPVWLGHGGEDPTVNIDQADAMAAVLKKAGKSFELRTAPGMVHGFFEPESPPPVLTAPSRIFG